LRHIRHKVIGATRVENGRELLAEVERLHEETALATSENGRCVCP
jgi:hypothetical protein